MPRKKSSPLPVPDRAKSPRASRGPLFQRGQVADSPTTGSGEESGSPPLKRGARGDFQTRFVYNRRLKSNARALRSKLTDAEQKLWFRLRRKQVLGVQFYRQKPLGPYIVDFYAPAVGLVLELDGSQHQEPRQKHRDAVRDAWLNSEGLQVLRFDDSQVLCETEQVLAVIHAAIQTRSGNPPALRAVPFSKGGKRPPPPYDAWPLEGRSVAGINL